MNDTKAYPSNEFDLSTSSKLGGTCFKNHEQGMDLRDYFAAKAMQSMITTLYSEDTKEDPFETLKTMKLVSKNAYWFADKMIKERDKK